jgi:hypothetical protein
MTNKANEPIEGALYEVTNYLIWNSKTYRVRNVFLGDLIIWISTDEMKFFHIREMGMCEVSSETYSHDGDGYNILNNLKLISKP